MSALARATDPAPSHEAAARLGDRRIAKAAVAWLLTLWPMTDFELTDEYFDRRVDMGWPLVQRDSIRKRRSELSGEGVVGHVCWGSHEGRRVQVRGYRGVS